MAHVVGVFLIFLLSAFSFCSATEQSTVGEENRDITTTEINYETENSTSLPILSRKRRYVVFPKGSSIQLVYCETVRTYVPLTKRFVFGVTMGLAWMLPTEAHELYLQKRDVDSTLAALAHAGLGARHRSDMYKVLEGFLSLKGLKGRDCLMRAVCEASETEKSENPSEETRRGSFMEELHKLLFSLPVHPKHKTPYDEAREHVGKCGQTYSGCHSFLDLEI